MRSRGQRNGDDHAEGKEEDKGSGDAGQHWALVSQNVGDGYKPEALRLEVGDDLGQDGGGLI